MSEIYIMKTKSLVSNIPVKYIKTSPYTPFDDKGFIRVRGRKWQIAEHYLRIRT